MASPFRAGDTVQTRFGRGVVREVRNAGRLLVDVQGRALLVAENEISAVAGARKRPAAAPRSERESKPLRAPDGARRLTAEIDLHGLTVEEAMERVQEALNDALLADLSELRFIHGRGGGRIRAALHRYLRDTSSVRSFRLDSRNDGVTIVLL